MSFFFLLRFKESDFFPFFNIILILFLGLPHQLQIQSLLHNNNNSSSNNNHYYIINCVILCSLFCKRKQDVGFEGIIGQNASF